MPLHLRLRESYGTPSSAKNSAVSTTKMLRICYALRHFNGSAIRCCGDAAIAFLKRPPKSANTKHTVLLAPSTDGSYHWVRAIRMKRDEALPARIFNLKLATVYPHTGKPLRKAVLATAIQIQCTGAGSIRQSVA